MSSLVCVLIGVIGGIGCVIVFCFVKEGWCVLLVGWNIK